MSPYKYIVTFLHITYNISNDYILFGKKQKHVIKLTSSYGLLVRCDVQKLVVQQGRNQDFLSEEATSASASMLVTPLYSRDMFSYCCFSVRITDSNTKKLIVRIVGVHLGVPPK